MLKNINFSKHILTAMNLPFSVARGMHAHECLGSSCFFLFLTVLSSEDLSFSSYELDALGFCFVWFGLVSQALGAFACSQRVKTKAGWLLPAR